MRRKYAAYGYLSSDATTCHTNNLFVIWVITAPEKLIEIYCHIHPPDVICSRFNSQCLWLNFWIKKSILLTLPFLSSNFFGLVKFGILIFFAIFSSLIDDHLIFDVFELFWLNDIQSKLQQKISLTRNWIQTSYRIIPSLYSLLWTIFIFISISSIYQQVASNKASSF